MEELKNNLYNKMREESIYLNFLERKIDKLNDSFPEQAEKIRAKLAKKEIELENRVKNMSSNEVCVRLGIF